MNKKPMTNACAGVFAFMLLASSGVFATSYSVTDLGVESYAESINNNGQVVGYFYESPLAKKSFIWSAGTGLIGFGDGGGISGANGINDSSQIAGTDHVGNNLAYTWDAALSPTQVGNLGGSVSFGNDINADGKITGYAYTTGDAAQRAYIWDSVNGMVNLGTLPSGGLSRGYGINDADNVVGYARDASNHNQAFIWWESTGTMDPIATLGGVHSYAEAINSSNYVAGYGQITTGQMHAYLWDNDNGIVDLNTLGGNASNAFGLNDNNEVVGSAQTSLNQTHAFIWNSLQGMTDLNDAVVDGDDWVFTRANDINETGQIVGYGTVNGETHGFLLTPVPEPATMLLLFSSVLGMLYKGKRKK